MERCFHVCHALLLLGGGSLGWARRQARRRSAENDGDAKSNLRFDGHCRISFCGLSSFFWTRPECCVADILYLCCVPLDLNRRAFEYTVHSSRMAMQDSARQQSLTDRSS